MCFLGWRGGGAGRCTVFSLLCSLYWKLDILVIGSEVLVIRGPLPVAGIVLLEIDINFFCCCRGTQGGIGEKWNSLVQWVLLFEF